MLIAQDNAAHGTRGTPANGLAYFSRSEAAGMVSKRGAAVPMTAPGRRPVRTWKWVVRRAPHQGLPVPHPVLSEARSSMPLIRLAFWPQSAQSRVQCSGVVRPHADCRSLRCFGIAYHRHAAVGAPAALGLRRLSRLADCLARARAAGSARCAPLVAACRHGRCISVHHEARTLYIYMAADTITSCTALYSILLI